MGADIHIYPEYDAGPFEGKPYWMPLSQQVHGDRDYDLFGKIAGVRGGGAMFPVRGFPADAGYSAKGDNHLFVYDSEGSEYAKPEAAASWVAQGVSRYTDESKAYVTAPDWHSHTWLTPAEFRQALEAPVEYGRGHIDSYWALLAMLEEMERRGKAARLVIWFDN